MSLVMNVQQAKTHLSRILARVQAGEDVTIARGGRPVARLVPVGAPPLREVGFVAGHLSDAFFEPLPGDELAAWE
ncbi:MAG: type II toxin-antitoxin system Phd/YefM family antitoxin [Kineosporiaceae bacterium]